jgi:hypothetical protein
MHVAGLGSKDVNSRGLDELSSSPRCGEVPGFVVNGLVDFRAGSDVAYLSLREDCRVDRFNGFNSLLRARNVRVKW